jgi:thiamine biosynthesis lipoprotein
MNRRDFLRPAHLAYPVGQLLAALDQISALPQPAIAPSEIALLRFSRRAMATTFEVVVPFATPDALEFGSASLDRIDELEAQLTVYRETSEVARLNRLAPYQTVVVEARLFDVLHQAQRISSETGGAFDVSTGALIRAWGFVRGPRRIPDEQELAQVRQRIGMDKIVLDPERKSVRYLCPGLEINLGSIGKGHALDVVASEIKRGYHVPAFLLHGGYSSVWAQGSPHQDDRGWMVMIRHPRDPDRTLARVWLRDQGLATSANTYQAFEWQGRQLGHLLDPRTGWPAEGMASVTVVARTSAEADALSTAFFVLGSAAARRYCETHPDIGAILLAEGDNAVPEFMGLALDKVRLDLGQPVTASLEGVAS